KVWTANISLVCLRREGELLQRDAWLVNAAAIDLQLAMGLQRFWNRQTQSPLTKTSAAQVCLGLQFDAQLQIWAWTCLTLFIEMIRGGGPRTFDVPGKKTQLTCRPGWAGARGKRRNTILPLPGEFFGVANREKKEAITASHRFMGGDDI